MPAAVTRDEVAALLARGAQLVDALPAEAHAASHLPGAINIPIKHLDARSVARLRADRPVVVYCQDAQWDISPRASSPSARRWTRSSGASPLPAGRASRRVTRLTWAMGHDSDARVAYTVREVGWPPQDAWPWWGVEVFR